MCNTKANVNSKFNANNAHANTCTDPVLRFLTVVPANLNCLGKEQQRLLRFALSKRRQSKRKKKCAECEHDFVTVAIWELGNWGIGKLGHWKIGELGNWGIGELGGAGECDIHPYAPSGR